jgi:hypothetical protein
MGIYGVRARNETGRLAGTASRVITQRECDASALGALAVA